MSKQIHIDENEFPADQREPLVEAELRLRKAADELVQAGASFTQAYARVPNKTAFDAEVGKLVEGAGSLHRQLQRFHSYFGEIIQRQSNRVRA